MTPPSCRADDHRDEHRQLRQLELVAVDLRRDEIILDHVEHQIERDDQQQQRWSKPSPPATPRAPNDKMKPMTGMKFEQARNDRPASERRGHASSQASTTIGHDRL